MTTPFEPGLWAHLACLWEATARKAGNVHPDCWFTDLTYLDFLHSAAAIAPVFAQAPSRSVGVIVLDAIQATRRVIKTNTNLGIVLLLAPLAKIPPRTDLRSNLASILDALSLEDSRHAYEAIRLAQPGGLGKVAQADVRDEPKLPLRAAMALAQDRDMIACQYTDGYLGVLDKGMPAMKYALSQDFSLEEVIQFTHLELMAQLPDSLIARKRGLAEAKQASNGANHVLKRGWPLTPEGRDAFVDLDEWLRAEGHSRNPGTSADLVTACLFVALWDGMIPLPLVRPWSRER